MPEELEQNSFELGVTIDGKDIRILVSYPPDGEMAALQALRLAGTKERLIMIVENMVNSVNDPEEPDA